MPDDEAPKWEALRFRFLPRRRRQGARAICSEEVTNITELRYPEGSTMTISQVMRLGRDHWLKLISDEKWFLAAVLVIMYGALEIIQTGTFIGFTALYLAILTMAGLATLSAFAGVLLMIKLFGGYDILEDVAFRTYPDQ